MRVSIVDVDNIQDKDFKIYRENGCSDHLFVVFKSPATVFADGEYVDAGVGKCILFDINKFQCYFPHPNHKFVHDFIHFYPETEVEKAIVADIPKGSLINLSLPYAISTILSEIKHETNNGLYKYKNDILNHLALAFLYRLKNEAEADYANKSIVTHFDVFYNLRSQIYLNPGKYHSIDEISKELCISRSYFQYLYKQFFNISITKDIISARLAKAKLILSSSNLPIYAVAEKCGYSNTEHFIRQFRNETGVTPQKFRK